MVYARWKNQPQAAAVEAESTLLDTLSVIVVDDHELVREAVGSAISQSDQLDLVALAPDGATGRSLIEAHQPDIAVIDFTLTDMTGLELIESVRPAAPRTRFMMLTGSPMDKDEQAQLSARVEGFLNKAKGRKTLITKILETSQAPRIPPREFFEDSGGLLNASLLTTRERELLHEIARGRSVREIADKLAISVATVRKHRENIMDKLELNTTAQLVRAALQIGQF